MAVELPETQEKENNIFNNQINKLKYCEENELYINGVVNYIIEKWKKYVRSKKKDPEEKDLSDLIDVVEFNKQRNALWLWLCLRSLEFMMLIEFLAKIDKELVKKRHEISSNISSNTVDNKDGKHSESEPQIEEFNFDEEYHEYLKESFLIEKSSFDKKYKEFIVKEYWEDWYRQIFDDIIGCVVTFYKNKDIAEIFKEAVSPKKQAEVKKEAEAKPETENTGK